RCLASPNIKLVTTLSIMAKRMRSSTSSSCCLFHFRSIWFWTSTHLASFVVLALRPSPPEAPNTTTSALDDSSHARLSVLPSSTSYSTSTSPQERENLRPQPLQDQSSTRTGRRNNPRRRSTIALPRPHSRDPAVLTSSVSDNGGAISEDEAALRHHGVEPHLQPSTSTTETIRISPPSVSNLPLAFFPPRDDAATGREVVVPPLEESTVSVFSSSSQRTREPPKNSRTADSGPLSSQSGPLSPTCSKTQSQKYARPRNTTPHHDPRECTICLQAAEPGNPLHPPRYAGHPIPQGKEETVEDFLEHFHPLFVATRVGWGISSRLRRVAGRLGIRVGSDASRRPTGASSAT
ncbi:unnamed protein product, partial [Amoebophrya sp. A120]